MRASFLVLLCSALSTARASVTVYGQIPLAQTNPAPPAQTTLAAYNDTMLTPPPVPNPPPARQYNLQLQRDAAAVPGLSIPHDGGSLWGFSIEMSVVSQVMGKNSSFISPTFLNLISNIVERAGGIFIRIGGNTQEFAVMVDHLEHGRTFGKEDSGKVTTTKTPAVLYTRDMFYMCSNISSWTNVKWFFGIPYNDSVNWRLTIAEEAQNILGDNLVALQAGNEPDFYVQFGRRVAPYDPPDYMNDVTSMLQAMDNNPRIPVKNKLIGPSVSSVVWTPEQLWQIGFMEKFKDRFYAFSAEHYPLSNCAAQFNTGDQVIPAQSVFPKYLTHKDFVVGLVQPYYNSANLAHQAGKPFFMFETNTASCGGFAGLSDTFGAALWAADYGFQLAYGNLTHAMMHIGGQNAFYNPFTSPPTNQSAFNQWTVGAVYYSTIILAEALGKSNTSQIIDLNGNGGNEFTPSYAIYENNVLSKVALFNYVDDPTRQSDLLVTIQVPQGNPASVKVKYLAAATVATKYNISWAGQTMGNKFEVDGRFRGELNTTTINCGAAGCVIPVPAPGFALVFLDTTEEVATIGQATKTFATTAHTNAHNTATHNPTTLVTSNGHTGQERAKGFASTNYGHVNGNGALSGGVDVGVVMVGSMMMGAVWMMRTLVR